jgi:predicted transcriptional regulator
MASDPCRLRGAESPGRIPVSITVDDWQSAIAEAMIPRPGEAGGKTTNELAETCGVSASRIKTALQRMHQEGRLSCTRKMVQSIDGSYRSVPAYSIRPAAESK